jgi:hypothetical protein
MSLLKGLRKHKDAGFEAMLKELMTIHETETIAGVDYNKLTPAQKGRTIRSMMFFKEKYKPNGMFDKLKARLVAGGHQQDRSVYSESDTSSPTVATEAVMMVAAIAARDAAINVNNDAPSPDASLAVTNATTAATAAIAAAFSFVCCVNRICFIRKNHGYTICWIMLLIIESNKRRR